MKLGELFFEQVLIGLLILATAALPWAAEIFGHLRTSDLSTILGLAGGTLLLAAAFIIGLLFDRVADSLTERLEVHNRLSFMFEKKLFKDTDPDPSDKDHDFYPEDKYRLGVLKMEKDVVVWINYHRSRIRVARAVMVYGPVTTLAAVVAVAMWASPASAHAASQLYWLAAAPLVYLVAAWATWKFDDKVKLPKTDKHKMLVAYANRHRSLMNLPTNKGAAEEKSPWTWRVLLNEPIVVCEVTLIFVALILALQQTQREFAITLWAILTALTMLSGWTWWRISLTYRGYILKAALEASAGLDSRRQPAS